MELINVDSDVKSSYTKNNTKLSQYVLEVEMERVQEHEFILENYLVYSY